MVAHIPVHVSAAERELWTFLCLEFGADRNLLDNPKVFGVGLSEVGDLLDKFNLFRCFRRGFESRAVEMHQVMEADRCMVNW